MNGLTRNDPDTIAFVTCCFLSGSIDHAELRAWGIKVIETTGDYPLYFLELINFDESRFHIYDVIGFVPVGNLSDNARKTIDQVAQYRKNILPDSMSTQDTNWEDWTDPNTVERFNEVFKDIVKSLPPDP